MKRNYVLVCALLLCVMSVQVALAQGGGRGRGQGRGMMGGGFMLLGIPEVQKELKMTSEQTDKVKAKQQEVMQATRSIMQEAGGFQALQSMSEEDRQKLMDKMQEVDKKAIAEVLNTDQQKRLTQLQIQQAGPMAFGRKDVKEALKLTDDQESKMRDIQSEQMQAMREAMQGVDFQNMTPEERQQMQKKMADMRKATMDKMLAVLDEGQQKTWKELTGEPFKGPLGPGGPGGGRRPRA